MIVLITNLSDAPGHVKGPTQVDIYNKTLNPGASIKIPADLVNQKIRSLAEGDSPLISIGNLPPWYVTAKTRKGTRLSDEVRKKRMEGVVKPVKEKKQPVEPAKE